MKKDWDTQALISRIEANRNPDFAVPMAAYMRGKFPFLGIKTPLRKELVKEHFSEYHLPKPSELSEVAWEIYHLPEREYQYVAIEVLEKMKNCLTVDDLPFLRQLIESKSWWDSVDAIAPRIVGSVVLANREDGSPIMLDWSHSDNLWTNRSAILHQLKYKEQTDTALLKSIILRHAGSTEFFLQKSIGWALREFAKTDAEWVRTFVDTHHLSPLSTREALKHLT
ncbi:MAG TPA: DNA alkylation repair protein [Planococcus sp. (in: firmicutes)]|nr:DNA alkylation repair protein [Planococcus sp. (in: firmicutes)]